MKNNIIEIPLTRIIKKNPVKKKHNNLTGLLDPLITQN